MRFTVSLVLGALVAVVTASNVLDLTEENWDAHIGKGKPALVEFFAPWCGHCKNLAPTYEELANVFAHAKERVIIAKVDADGAGRSLGAKYGIKGFPTIKWFDEVGVDQEYKGGRDLQELASYVEKSSGVRSKLPGPPEPKFEVVHENNWNEIVMNPDKHVLVSYTVDAAWCRDCKDAKLTWEKVAEWFKPDENVVLANVNLDEPRNTRLTGAHDIVKYPTIRFFAKGNKTPEVYEGGLTDKDIVAFLNKKTNANRSVGGGLNLAAGRLPDLDEIAEKFVAASKSARADLLKQAKEIAAKVGNTGAQYVKVMEKINSGASAYVEKERKRLKVIASKAVDLKKQDEIKVKDNILRAFQTQDARDKHDL